MKASLLAIAVVVVACGGSGAATTSTVPASTTTTATPPTNATTTSVAATTSTSAPADAGPTDCLEIWPESLIQDVAGAGVEFFAANDDRSACTYLGDTGGIALAWRPSSLEDFEESRTGASATDPIVDREICDAGYSTEPAGPTLIVEAYSEAMARTFTATISGADPDDAIEWATELLTAAC
jgi:hypothetical protein